MIMDQTSYVASYKGHKDIVRLLLQYDAIINATNNLGYTALDIAKTETTILLKIL